ncbi:MAG: M23 family metallopeptidase [Rubrobacteraceae bacterium]
MANTVKSETVERIPNVTEEILQPVPKNVLEEILSVRSDDLEPEATRTARGHADESHKLYVGKEFTPDELREWWKAQRLGSLPFNAVGIHHTYIPNEQQWRGVTSLDNTFGHYRNKLGWPAGVGPHLWLYDGTGPYESGRKLIYVGTHPAHDGIGMSYRNHRWLHIEAIGYYDHRPMPREMVDLYRFALRTVCGDRIPIRDAGRGVDGPGAPLGLMFHRNGFDSKTCPGSQVEESWFFAAMNEEEGVSPVDPLTVEPPMVPKRYNFAAVGEKEIEVARVALESMKGVGITDFALADTPEKVRYVSQKAHDSEPAGRLVCIVVGASTKEHLSPEAREDLGRYDLGVSDLWSAAEGDIDQTKRLLADEHLPEIWSREAPRLSILLTDTFRERVGIDKETIVPDDRLPKGTVWGVSNVKYIVPFNYRRQTSHGLQNVHKGEDVVAAEGSQILAVADGRVVRLRENRPDSGYWQDFTVLYESISKYVLYGHVLRGASLPEGASFEKGQRISRIGTLRDALNTVEHTHVQVWNTEAAMLAFDNPAAVDPKNVRLALGEQEYEGPVARSAIPGNWTCPGCVEDHEPE